jgi:hypothetical protein
LVFLSNFFQLWISNIVTDRSLLWFFSRIAALMLKASQLQ